MTTNGTDRVTGWRFVLGWTFMIFASLCFWYGVYHFVNDVFQALTN